MISSIILDFDGVILESVSVKTEVFRKLFSTELEHVDEIVKFHLNNGGMSRFEKFNYIYKNILKRELTLSKFQKLSDNFSSLVFDEIIKVPFVPGAYEFLEKFHTKIPLYVVSATPEDELVRIVIKRGLAQFFQNIYGSPRKKADCIHEIINLARRSPDSVIFVGDAKNDFEAAQSVGARFIGRVKPGDENRFLGLTGIDALIPDLNELARYIEVNS